MLAAASLTCLAAGLWLLVASWRPWPPAISQQARTQLAPPEQLRMGFGLTVAMVASGPGDGDVLQLQPDTDGVIRLRGGDEVKFQIKVAQQAYVGIWTINADGTIEQLFPNAGEKDHRFVPDEEEVVPRTRAVAVPSGGIDWVWVQASTSPWDPDKGQRVGPFLLFKTDRERDLWAQRRRSIQLQPEGTLAEAVLKYQVTER
jgi:hypothetical protein